MREENAEGVCYLQPRVDARSAATLGNRDKQIPTLKGLRNRFRCECLIFCEHTIQPRLVLQALGNPFRVAISCSLVTQGSRAACIDPGLKVANAFGVSSCNESCITQVYQYGLSGFLSFSATNTWLRPRVNGERNYTNTP